MNQIKLTQKLPSLGGAGSMFGQTSPQIIYNAYVPLGGDFTAEHVERDHMVWFGGDDGGRTRDLRNAIAALSQLSYVPNLTGGTLRRPC